MKLSHGAVKMETGLFCQVPENKCQKAPNVVEVSHTKFIYISSSLSVGVLELGKAFPIITEFMLISFVCFMINLIHVFGVGHIVW